MARFFAAGSNIFGGVAGISWHGADCMRALRIRRGESFTVCGGNGMDYTCRMEGSDGHNLNIRITDARSPQEEPNMFCVVCAAYAKGSSLDDTVRKAVDLGASGFLIFPSAGCSSPPTPPQLRGKTRRLQRIAEEAARQAGRGRIPRVTAAASFESAVRAASKADLPLFCYESEEKLGILEALKKSASPKTVSVMTGPKDGFTPNEASYATAHGMVSVTLGQRILRWDTAPLCALTAVMLYTSAFEADGAAN